MTLAIVVMAYLAFGLLLMDLMCPLWHPFEKLIGALIWPISAGIGVWMFFKKPETYSHPEDDLLLLLCMTLVLTTLSEKKPKESETPEAP